MQPTSDKNLSPHHEDSSQYLMKWIAWQVIWPYIFTIQSFMCMNIPKNPKIVPAKSNYRRQVFKMIMS
jgi:hypothetical protein